MNTETKERSQTAQDFLVIKNDVPNLLHALCNHQHCPEWLRGLIWDEMNERVESNAYSLGYLTYLFNASRFNENCEVCDRRISQGYPHPDCVQKGRKV